MRVIALQDYTDQYISLFEGEIRDIEDLLANILLEKGVVGLNFPDDVSISQTTTTGTEIANISINGNSTTLYAPAGGNGNALELFYIYNVVNNAQFNQITHLEDGNNTYLGEFNLPEGFDPTLPYAIVIDFKNIQTQQTEIKYAPGFIVSMNSKVSATFAKIDSELLSNTFQFSINVQNRTIDLYYEAENGQPYSDNIYFNFNIYQMTEHGIVIALAGVGAGTVMSLWEKLFVPIPYEKVTGQPT